ncbi:hypothetical protein [Bradyrhizobium sp. Ce-3]|uniref:hypothetical protein n=1 Tax=Bradyrhizobium sp. Ce-3 TaxID=2913970 RepID=UPI001FC7DFD7|nr:hypothetical protein [Bradyrhizobium sp. Ce-3]GKQ53204.1 hypothetical protein BRSPCE3_40590 [Bradyrhizobium sp. Ce-3]
MTRLVLTFTDSGAGGLKAARLADCVIGVELRFVCGKLPAASQLDALLSPRAAPRRTGAHWLDSLSGGLLADTHRQGLGLIEFCERFDAVDLWVDPDPNSQLQLVWLLDYLHPHVGVTSRLAILQMDQAIGEQQPTELAARQPRLAPIYGDHLETARDAWTAWRASTPESWFKLLRRDLGALPQLRNTVVALLEELPSRSSGLGATETRMLELLSAGHVHPYDLFPGHDKLNERKTFGYWEIGSLLDGLARCQAPAISGLDEGPFDLDMHEDRDRHQRYKRGRLALTELGQAIVAGAADFSQYNAVHRWWGGTELTNDRLWRWDAESRTLVAP